MLSTNGDKCGKSLPRRGDPGGSDEFDEPDLFESGAAGHEVTSAWGLHIKRQRHQADTIATVVSAPF